MRLQQLLKTAGKRCQKDKGMYVFRQGEADRSLYFVESGLLKAYYTSAEGKVFIKSFILENDIISSLAASHSEGDCTFSLICLEPSTLIEIPFAVIREHSANDLEIANELVEVLLNFAMKKERREYEFLCLSAEQQFLRLVETTPTLLDKVTQNDIAAYLGVTPVGLSRIKKRTQQERL